METTTSSKKGKSHGSVKTRVNLDANSARNAAFYKQDGFTNMYPKSQVYPVEGSEFQIEQLRARLPKYCPPPQTELCYDDMELTMACTTNITINPDINKENASGTLVSRYPMPPVKTRQPLQALVKADPVSTALSLDEKLERLCREKQDLGETVGQPKGGREDSSEVISELLDDMMLQQSVKRETKRQSNKALLKPVSQACLLQQIHVHRGEGEGAHSVSGINIHGDASSLINQENCQPHLKVQYPPPTTASMASGCVTRLNFSDAESSLGTSQFTEDSLAGRASVLGCSQVGANEQSGAGQSFEVFHDSWRNQSHNTSHGRHSALQHVPDKQLPTSRYFGKPLETKCKQENRLEPNISSFADSYMYDQSQSFQAGASKSNMSSFSAYEDSVEQSSFVPFHDSWINSSKEGRQPPSVDHQTHLPRETRRALRPVSAPLQQEQQQQQLEKREGGVVYHAALGVPLEGDGVGDGNASAIDQSFTQVGICHPRVAPSISTPVGKKIDITFDISRIQTEVEAPTQPPPDNGLLPPSDLPFASQWKRRCSCAPNNLSTIKEESSSLKSSHSTTGSSSSSSTRSSHSGHETLGSHISAADMNVNPFSLEIVNMMLNAAMTPSLVESVCSVPSSLPQLVSGRSVLLGSEKYSELKRVTSGGFGTIYTCKHGGKSKVLKVQKPALKWEIAIISELHTRLKMSNLLSNCFVKTEQSYVFNDASIMVLPHYNHGSLLDLANAYGANLNESFLFYYTVEVLEIVASLHHCGILYTDIKPDNLMLTDLSLHKNFTPARGHGLVLIDFGRVVDLTAFSGDIMFQGSSNTEGFQCTQMLEGKPWKYEADYFGIAATVHVLLTGQYMSVVKDAQTNLYRPQKSLRRPRHPSLWIDFFNCLLNTTQPLPLPEMAAEMRTQLEGVMEYVFHARSRKMIATVQKHLTQHS